MTDVRVGFVGAGFVAQRHAEALAGLEGVRLTAVVDTVIERAERLASASGALAFDRLEPALSHVDVVYVLTPAGHHREPALTAAAAGKHLLVEKPLDAHVDDARAIVDAARDAGVLLMTGLNMRHRPGFRRVKEAVDAGDLGEPVNLWSHRVGIGLSHLWPPATTAVPGLAVESFSHDIDLIHWWGGDIADVAAHLVMSRPEIPGAFDTDGAVVFSLTGGAVAGITASWTSHIQWNTRGVVGTEGTAMVTGRGQWHLTRFHKQTAGMAHEVVEILDDRLDAGPYREQSRHFLACIREGTQPQAAGEDGLRALVVADAVMRSHRERARVPVDYRGGMP